MNADWQRDVMTGIRSLEFDRNRRLAAILVVFCTSIFITGAPSVVLLMLLYFLAELGLHRLHAVRLEAITWRRTVVWLVLVEVATLAIVAQSYFLAQTGEAPTMRLAYFIVAGIVLHGSAVKAVSFLLGAAAPIAPIIGFSSLLWMEYDGTVEWVALAVGLVVIVVYSSMTNFPVARRHRDLRTARRRADAAAFAKGRFLAAMSHEIRTPLNGIIGLAEVMQTRLENREDREDIAVMLSSGLHLKAMLDEVLDHAKLEAGEMTFSPEPVDLDRLTRDVTALFGGRIRQKGLAHSVEIDPALPMTVGLDGMRVRQILSNLLSNAVKFTDAGSIRVRVRWRAGEATGITISVIDTGCGIPADRQASLFADYSQVDDRTERAAGGTGLGLAIARELARAMGGDLKVHSVPGTGSEFSFALPAEACVDDRAEDPPPDAATGPVDLAGWTILVVDDNRVNRLVLRKMLEPTGAHVADAGNGEEALGRMKEAGLMPDVVLLDMNMPVLDGPGFIAVLDRRWGKILRPKIVMLTANSEEDARAALGDDRFDSYVSKPITRAALFEALAALGIASPKPQPHKI